MKLFLCNLLGASLLLSLFTFSSCNKVDDEGNPVYKCDNNEFGTANSAGFSFRLKDSDNPEIYLLDIIDYPCDRDSIKVFKESGEEAANIFFRTDGRIGWKVIAFEEDHTDAFLNEQVREFYAYINYRHVDTFRFEYKFLEAECNYTVFDYARVLYNGRMLYEIDDETTLGGPDIQIDSLRYNRCPF